MEIIKAANNVELDVIYDDGTRKRVKEGVLHEVENEEIIFHNGTDRAEVWIAAAEDMAGSDGYAGKCPLFAPGQSVYRSRRTC